MEDVRKAPLKAKGNQKDKQRSSVWDHFTLIKQMIDDVETEFAKCRYCASKYNRSDKSNKSTGNLIRHLKGKHEEIGKNLKLEKGFDENIFEQEQTEFVFSQDKYRAAILNLLILDDQPFTEPRRKAFVQLIRTLNPEALPISNTTLRRDLMEKLAELEVAVKLEISKVPGKISFTTDCWTTKSLIPFMNIRAHWIDHAWKLRSILLDFVFIDGKHSGVNLFEIFKKCLTRFNIPLSKVFALTLDNASNNDTFIAALQKYMQDNGITVSLDDDHHIRCLAHVMNLVVQDILSALKSPAPITTSLFDDEAAADEEEFANNDVEVSDDEDEFEVESDGESDIGVLILPKLRTLVKKIRKSHLMRQRLKLTCTKSGIKFLVPIIDVKSRWNYTFKMIQRAEILKVPLQTMCKKYKSLRPFLISKSEWLTLNSVKSLLQKFERATNFVSMERHNTISAYLPILDWLTDSLKTFIKDNTGSLAEATKIGLVKLQKYKVDLRTSKIPFVTTFLNPALKMSYFRAHKYTKASIKKIEAEIYSVFKNEYEGTIVYEDNNEKSDECFSHIYKKAKMNELHDEFHRYARLPLSSTKTDILEFWKSQEADFPCLSKMARDYLGGQTTSVPVERDFSGGVDLITPTRCSLNSETIRACMILKNWLKNL